MKMKHKKTTKTNLSDKIAAALTVKPRADIEDDHVFGTRPKTLSQADLSSSGSEDEAAISDFRKRNVNLLSEISKKYEGEVVKRKSTLQDSSELSEDLSGSEADSNTKLSSVSAGDHVTSSDDEAEVINGADNASHSEQSHSDAESDDYSITKSKQSFESDEESADGDGSEDDEGEGYDISQMEEPVKEQFEHIKKQNVSEEAKKGNCVRNQLLIWEGLLEMRIHLQRCVNTANQMPLPETYAELKQRDEFIHESNGTKANVVSVLEKLLTLQNTLLQQNSETKALSCNKKQKDKGKMEVELPESDEEIPSDTEDEEIPSDTEDEDKNDQEKSMNEPKIIKESLNTKKRKLDDYEKEISTSHKVFKSFRDTTIQKWNEKTRLATATNIKSTPTNSVLQQISYILSDKNKLIKRTQLKRSDYEIVGYNKENTEEDTQNGSELNIGTRDRKDNDEYIPEIFDDSDFYHQLLRELIECKSSDISDPVQLSRQWIALQQMRSKMKRKVDTKATKGRKIKYVVHNKLVNYMASEKCTTWTDESTNELYSSLFGKLFEQNNVGVNAKL